MVSLFIYFAQDLSSHVDISKCILVQCSILPSQWRKHVWPVMHHSSQSLNLCDRNNSEFLFYIFIRILDVKCDMSFSFLCIHFFSGVCVCVSGFLQSFSFLGFDLFGITHLHSDLWQKGICSVCLIHMTLQTMKWRQRPRKFEWNETKVVNTWYAALLLYMYDWVHEFDAVHTITCGKWNFTDKNDIGSRNTASAVAKRKRNGKTKSVSKGCADKHSAHTPFLLTFHTQTDM